MDAQLAAAARELADVDAEPQLSTSKAYGRGFSFPDSGRWAAPFVPYKAAKAAVKAKKAAAAAAKQAAKPASTKPAAAKPAAATRKQPADATPTPATSSSGTRCSGECRLARPCPTEKNQDGRGACGNLGCADTGAVYGCRTCGIRLCSMECINAHMFEGRAIKPRLGLVKFHDWYTGE